MAPPVHTFEKLWDCLINQSLFKVGNKILLVPKFIIYIFKSLKTLIMVFCESFSPTIMIAWEFFHHNGCSSRVDTWVIELHTLLSRRRWNNSSSLYWNWAEGDLSKTQLSNAKLNGSTQSTNGLAVPRVMLGQFQQHHTLKLHWNT